MHQPRPGTGTEPIPRPCPAAHPLPPPPPYVSPTTGATFSLRLQPLGSAAAEEQCNLVGAHLAGFASREEQVRMAGRLRQAPGPGPGARGPCC